VGVLWLVGRELKLVKVGRGATLAIAVLTGALTTTFVIGLSATFATGFTSGFSTGAALAGWG
jgi:hypothetical protein